MNDENLSIKDILDWYVAAGVDEIVGDVPVRQGHVSRGKGGGQNCAEADSVVKPVGLATHPVQAESTAEGRKATTELAQATINACKNARELCEKAGTLEELKELVEKFEGCALKLTATRTVFGHGSASARIMLIGEAPGADEDRTGVPFGRTQRPFAGLNPQSGRL